MSVRLERGRNLTEICVETKPRFAPIGIQNKFLVCFVGTREKLDVCVCVGGLTGTMDVSKCPETPHPEMTNFLRFELLFLFFFGHH